MLDVKIFGTLSLAIGFLGYCPYFWGLYRRTAKPHAFTWFIWGLVMVIAFLIQFTSGGGAGSWVTGFSALVCLLVAGLALFIGEKNITKSDWISFVAALIAIPLWLVVKLPLASMILIVVIEFLGTYPTFRKSWSRPQDEPALSYSITGIKFIFSFFALENINLITALYPIAMIAMNALLVTLLLARRKILFG